MQGTRGLVLQMEGHQVRIYVGAIAAASARAAARIEEFVTALTATVSANAAMSDHYQSMEVALARAMSLYVSW
jgi:hypothetical protein